ncbi:MAG: curli production assembly/transport protein CsgE [Cytophagaceae bacterium]|nr:curli production assembly/transport protein CsgE [Cytophagaceae bacterium]
MGYRIIAILVLLLSSFSLAYSQDDPESSGLELNGMLIEGLFDENITTSLVLDNTRTKLGRDFYELFYQDWSETAADTSQLTSVMQGLNPDDFIVTIEEQPSPVSGSVLSVLINEQIVWQQFIQPRYEVVVDAANSATDLVSQYFLNYQEIQRQLESDDMKGTGIF